MLPTLCKQMSKERPIHWTSFHLGSCSSTFVHARCLTKQRLTILIFCKTNIRREISTLDESQPWVSVSLLDLCSARCLSKTKGNVTLMYSIACQDVPQCWYNSISSWDMYHLHPGKVIQTRPSWRWWCPLWKTLWHYNWQKEVRATSLFFGKEYPNRPESVQYTNFVFFLTQLSDVDQKAWVWSCRDQGSVGADWLSNTDFSPLYSNFVIPPSLLRLVS